EDLPVAQAVTRQALALPDDSEPVLTAADPAPGASAAGDATRLTAPMTALASAGEAPAAEEDTPSGRFYCRVRSVDGTWRHVECAVLPYEVPGEQPQML